MKHGTVRFKFALKARRSQRTSMGTEPAAPSRAARMLALAHHVERLVEAGELTGYAEAARVLGLTRARMTQVMKLLLLAPRIQERMLDPRASHDVPVAERALRRVLANPAWEEQCAIQRC